MNKAILGCGMALLVLTAPRLAAAEPAQPPAAPSPPAGPGSAQGLEAARAALQSIDIARLVGDRVYAEEILRYVDMLDADESGLFDAMDRSGIRTLALAALARRQEAQAGIDRLVLSAPTEVQPHVDAWWSALILEDPARAINVLEGASQHVHDVDRAELRRLIGSSAPRALLARLSGDAGRPLRARLAAALLRIGWPGETDRIAGDVLRMMVLNDRLERGDSNGAAGIAATITSPAVILPLIVLRRYDPVIGPGRDRLGMLRAALAEEDRETAQALAQREPSLDRILARARYLRAVGRNAEAWTLVEPSTRDVAATVASGDSGIWLISQAARALLALGRKDEAVALDTRLVAVPITVNSELINVYINH